MKANVCVGVVNVLLAVVLGYRQLDLMCKVVCKFENSVVPSWMTYVLCYDVTNIIILFYMDVVSYKLFTILFFIWINYIENK